MGKPRMIILIRHAQSEGNKNREIHQSIPDHRVKLTAEGHRQACEAGSKLRDLLRPDDTLHFFTSPYRRTRETTEGILESLTSDDPAPSPFPRHTIKVYEEPRLREQDFGNFQPCSAEMERMWLERADYGHFFYRIPNGESAADAYDRVSGFNESLWRLFGENDFASVCILVTHGLMTRVFLMKWYHWSVEYFEDLRNINHCEFVVMKLNPDNGKYKLENQMRTWSELRKQKELDKKHEHAAKGTSNPIPSPHPALSDAHVPIRRRWGGCPDGCDHGLSQRPYARSARATAVDTHRYEYDAAQKATTETSQQDTPQDTNQETLQTIIEPGLGDRPMMDGSTSPGGASQPASLLDRTRAQSTPSSTALSTDDLLPHLHHHNSHPKPTLPAARRPKLTNLHRDSENHLFHPPRSRSNFALLHLGGRDGGGSLSGANSAAPSEDERDDLVPKTASSIKDALTKKAVANSSNNTPTSAHQTRPSQDIGNDGDDEGSGKQSQRLRRSRSHHHHHHHHHNTARRDPPRNFINTDTLGDRATDEGLDQDQDHDPEMDQENGCDHDHGDYDDRDDDREGDNGGDDALEAERRQDQSIRESVY